MGRFVIAAYRPKPGRQAQLIELVSRHAGVLRAQGLISDRSAYVMRAAGGTVLEVFEWRSAEAIDEAHRNSAVQALWAEFGDACAYAPLIELAEAQHPFAEFDAVSL